MSVEGVALATTIAQYISAVWVLLILIKDNADYKLYIKNNF
jgi:Na+-driven multidrug efflux pump